MLNIKSNKLSNWRRQRGWRR